MSLTKSKNRLEEALPFTKYEATQQLNDLALKAIDLSRPDQITPERLADYYGEACGYRLLYGTERVTEEVLRALSDLAKEAKALEKMEQMQNGEIMNMMKNCPSENRPVLHTATRDFFDHPRTTPVAKEAAHLARNELDKLRSFIAKLDTEKKFDDLIVIAIGGSEQGSRASYFALQNLLKSGRHVHFISNVDPDDTAAVLKKVNLERTLVAVISKSGVTLETDTNEEIVRNRLKKAGLNPREHFISITMPGTPMDNQNKYMETFYIWEWVGGRLSTSSVVGGIVLAFAFGFDVFWEMLKGAHDMDRAALQPDLKKNLPLLAALLGIWNRNFLHYPTMAIIPYSRALKYYPAHLQQVDMESNGKLLSQEGTFVDFQTGPILWGSVGTDAQHSYFQLLHQGTETVPLLIIGFKKSQYQEDLELQGTTSQEKLLANLFAQSLGLALGRHPENPNKFCPGNRPSTVLLAEQLTPYALGALLAFYEHKVAFQGFIWGINSFDQEGVQLGKILANQLIEQFAAKRDKNQKAGPDPLGNAYLKHLDHFR